MPNPLRLAATVEVISLAALLTNLLTVHAEAVSSVLGPLHGGAYLTVIVITLLTEGASVRTRLLAVIPGIGGLLAARALNRPQDETP
jgi:hypothetical protein